LKSSIPSARRRSESTTAGVERFRCLEDRLSGGACAEDDCKNPSGKSALHQCCAICGFICEDREEELCLQYDRGSLSGSVAVQTSLSEFFIRNAGKIQQSPAAGGKRHPGVPVFQFKETCLFQIEKTGFFLLSGGIYGKNAAYFLAVTNA